MFQQQDLEGLGSDARTAVLALMSCVALVNLLDHTAFFFLSQKLDMLITVSVLWKGKTIQWLSWECLNSISNPMLYE